MEGTRELVLSDTPYVVAYQVQGDSVDIVAVVHGARKWPPGYELTWGIHVDLAYLEPCLLD